MFFPSLSRQINQKDEGEKEVKQRETKELGETKNLAVKVWLHKFNCLNKYTVMSPSKKVKSKMKMCVLVLKWTDLQDVPYFTDFKTRFYTHQHI